MIDKLLRGSYMTLARRADKQTARICERHGFEEKITCLYCLEVMPTGLQDIPAHLDKCPRQFGE